MPLASSARFHIGSRHLLILALVIGASLLATKAWKSSLWGRWTASAGPFVEFEVRLPSGILLPDDKNIELTLWANGTGRGCRMAVRRSAEPPDIAGKCSIIVNSAEYVMSLRLSRFYEGYWRLPIGRYPSRDPVFTAWQRVEFTRAPAGKKELSALPHGEYYIRYLVRS